MTFDEELLEQFPFLQEMRQEAAVEATAVEGDLASFKNLAPAVYARRPLAAEAWARVAVTYGQLAILDYVVSTYACPLYGWDEWPRRCEDFGRLEVKRHLALHYAQRLSSPCRVRWLAKARQAGHAEIVATLQLAETASRTAISA